MIALVMPIVGMVFAGVVVFSALYFKQRDREQWHETARVAMEKGLPVPPMPASNEAGATNIPPGVSFEQWDAMRRANRRHSDLKGGLIMMGIGAGLFFGLRGDAGHIAGAIPTGIGLALCLSVVFDGVTSRR